MSHDDVDSHTLTDQELTGIATKCQNLGNELLAFIASYEVKREEVQRNGGGISCRVKGKITADLTYDAKTLCQAVRRIWDKPKADAISKELDHYRKLLDSAVLYNAKESLKQLLRRTDETLAWRNRTQKKVKGSLYNIEGAIHNVSGTIERENLQSYQRHEEVLEAINSFPEALEKRIIFPPMPKHIVNYDPSLQPAACMDMLRSSKLYWKNSSLEEWAHEKRKYLKPMRRPVPGYLRTLINTACLGQTFDNG